MDRRSFLWRGFTLAAPVAASQAKNENVYRFATADCDIRMTVEFYDRYTSARFWFNERKENREFCLSATGQEGQNCLPNFTGSLAVAHYHIRPRSKSPRLVALREHVRTIDQDERLQNRAPFERAIELRQGIASDLQAFGYETGGSHAAESPVPTDPWCFLRQDLYFDGGSTPFLIVHWKHTLSAIRILDVIPGAHTWPA